MSPHFKLPLAHHPDVSYCIVDADGVHIMTCGRNGDGVQAGKAIAAEVIARFNGGVTVTEFREAMNETVDNKIAEVLADLDKPASEPTTARKRVTSMSNRKPEE